MRKRYSFDRLFEGNMLVLFCVIFTVNVVIRIILAGLQGTAITLGVQSLIWSTVYISAPLLPLAIIQHLLRSGYMEERDYLLWISAPVHYLISAGLTVFYVFIQGLFMPLPERMFIFALVNYTIMYIIIVTGAIIIDLLQTARVNKNLRKIQEKTKCSD